MKLSVVIHTLAVASDLPLIAGAAGVANGSNRQVGRKDRHRLVVLHAREAAWRNTATVEGYHVTCGPPHGSPTPSCCWRENVTLEENKVIARRMVDAWNHGDLDALDDVIAPDYHFHDPADPNLPHGSEGAKQQLTAFRTAFPDLHFTIAAEIAEGDLVVQRLTGRGTHRGAFMGVPPTGQLVTLSSIEVMRIEGGKIVEHWDELDALGILRQLGALPSTGAAGQAP